MAGGEIQMRLEFGGVCINHLVESKPLFAEAQLVAKTVEDEVNFTHSSTVKSATKGGEQLNDDGIRVTLHRIKWLDHWQLSLPLIVLLYNSSEIRNQERSVFNASSDSIVNQLGY